MKNKLSRSIDVILVFAALAAIFGCYLVVHDDIHFVRVVSNSMAPAIHKGDVLIVKSIPTRNLEVGQVAILPTLEEPSVYYAHRIISKEITARSQVLVKTKGDANPIPDDWKLEITSEKVPIYLGQLPTSKIPFFHINRWIVSTVFVLILLLFSSLFLPGRDRVDK